MISSDLLSCFCRSWNSSTTNGLKNTYAQLLENWTVGEVPKLAFKALAPCGVVLLIPGSASSPVSLSLLPSDVLTATNSHSAPPGLPTP